MSKHIKALRASSLLRNSTLTKTCCRAKNPPKIPHPVHPEHLSHSLHTAGEVGSNSSSDRDRSGLLDLAEVELPGTTEGRCAGHQNYSDLDAASTSLSMGLEHPNRVVEQCSFTSNQVSDLYSIRKSLRWFKWCCLTLPSLRGYCRSRSHVQYHPPERVRKLYQPPVYTTKDYKRSIMFRRFYLFKVKRGSHFP